MILTTKNKIKLIHTKFVVKRKNYNIYIIRYLSKWMKIPSHPINIRQKPHQIHRSGIYHLLYSSCNNVLEIETNLLQLLSLLSFSLCPVYYGSHLGHRCPIADDGSHSSCY